MENPSERLLYIHSATHDVMAANYGKLPGDLHADNWKYEMSRFKRPFFYIKNRPDSTNIDETFNKYDYEAAKATLNPNLYNPIGRIAMRSSISGWANHASIDDIAKYLEWNHNRANMLNYALHRDSREFYEGVMNGIENLINIGYFPQQARWETEAAYRRTRVQQLDSIQAGIQFASGLYYSIDDSIHLANLYDEPLAMNKIGYEMGRVVMHEYIHASGKYGGFEIYDVNHNQSWRAIDEAFTEHSTVVALNIANPEPTKIDPAMRKHDTLNYSTYHPERKLLQRITDTTNVSIHDIASIYFQPQDKFETDKQKRDLLRKIGQKCGSEDFFIDAMLEYENANRINRNKIIARITKRLE